MIIYDIEIKNAIPDRKSANLPGITYCRGWDDHANMGISVIGAYDMKADAYHVYLEDNFSAFQSLIEGRTVVGFNSIPFDDVVCAAHGITVKTHYDILREVYAAKGLNPFPARFSSEYAGYGLDALCEATLGMKKTGHGGHAPVLWQQGKYGEVIDYCLNDVRLSVALMRRIWSAQGITDPKTGDMLFPAKPKGLEQT